MTETDNNGIKIISVDEQYGKLAKRLRKKADKLTDVNYHTEAGILYDFADLVETKLKNEVGYEVEYIANWLIKRKWD